MITKFCLLEVCCRTLKAQNIIVDTLMKGYLDLGELPSTSTILNIMNTENKKEIVYCYTFKNGKRYIGKTAYPEKRCLKSHQYNKTQPVYHALKNAEENGDTVDLTHLSGYVDDKVASSIEKHYIALYRTNIARYLDSFGYNLTDGGEGASGWKANKKQRANNAAAQTGKKFTEKHKANMSAAQLGRNHTEKTKTKMAAVAKVKHNRHETRILHSLTTQLYYHEKRLEKAGLLECQR